MVPVISDKAELHLEVLSQRDMGYLTCVLCGSKGQNATVFKFPVRAEIRAKWLSACRIADVKGRSGVCIKHFAETDLSETTERIRLKVTAVPKTQIPGAGPTSETVPMAAAPCCSCHCHSRVLTPTAGPATDPSSPSGSGLVASTPVRLPAPGMSSTPIASTIIPVMPMRSSKPWTPGSAAPSSMTGGDTPASNSDMKPSVKLEAVEEDQTFEIKKEMEEIEMQEVEAEEIVEQEDQTGDDEEDVDSGGVSRFGRVRKRSSKLADYGSPQEKARPRKEGRDSEHAASKQITKQPRMTAYLLWARDVREIIVQNDPDLQFSEVNKRLGVMWHALPDGKKYNFKRKAKRFNSRAMSEQAESTSAKMNWTGKGRGRGRGAAPPPPEPSAEASESMELGPEDDWSLWNWEPYV